MGGMALLGILCNSLSFVASDHRESNHTPSKCYGEVDGSLSRDGLYSQGPVTLSNLSMQPNEHVPPETASDWSISGGPFLRMFPAPRIPISHSVHLTTLYGLASCSSEVRELREVRKGRGCRYHGSGLISYLSRSGETCISRPVAPVNQFVRSVTHTLVLSRLKNNNKLRRGPSGVNWLVRSTASDQDHAVCVPPIGFWTCPCLIKTV